MIVAYLVNQYPTVSHTFIRREIRALESVEVKVVRFSIRPMREDRLPDADDREECRRTRVILSVGLSGLALACLRRLLVRPGHWCAGLHMTWRLGRRSDRGLLRHLAYFAEACVLVPWLAQARCTHAHAHFGTNSATVALLARILGGPPFSFTVHGPEEFDKPKLLGLETKIHYAVFVAGVSSFGRSQLFRQSSHEDWWKVQVVRCGVDDTFLTSEPPSPTADARLVCVGRLCEQKGQLLLVEAAARVASAGVAFELVLVGDGEIRPQIETLIAHHALVGRVQITGWVSGERVRAEIAAARALVLPSFAEGLPVVIMESLAMGRPVVSTYVGGIPELVVPGECGWLVPAGSIGALAAAMTEVLRTPAEDLERMGAHGRARVLAQHNASKIAGQLKRLFLDTASAEGEIRAHAGKRADANNHF